MKALTTERQWLAAGSWFPVCEAVQSRQNARKMWLFGCACCRRLGDLLTDKRSVTAIEVAEQFADGAVKRSALVAARAAANAAVNELGQTPYKWEPDGWAANAAEMVAHGTAKIYFQLAATRAAEAISQAGVRTNAAEINGLCSSTGCYRQQVCIIRAGREQPSTPSRERPRPARRWRGRVAGSRVGPPDASITVRRADLGAPRAPRAPRERGEADAGVRAAVVGDGDDSYREIVRQQYTFSPPGTAEVENYRVDLDGVTALELRIVPNIGGGETRASVVTYLRCTCLVG